MSQSDQKTKQPQFHKLSPLNNLESSIYFEALEEKLKDVDVKNIALTGGYGTGKSSIIESYIKHKGIESSTLRISLANFCENGQEIDETKIEEQILQQLFYQLSHKDIPLTSFKKISFWSKTQQFWIIFAAIVWLLVATKIPKILSIVGANLDYINANGFKALWKSTNCWGSSFNFILLVVFGAGLFFIIRKVLQIKQKGQLKKVTMKSATIELSEESVLNKHIDELIYFFECTPNNLVIIEDLDRFDSTILFSKLREVNFMLNNTPKYYKKITFLYAIKDNVFKDNHNRTKFFDFILPVVPVINTTNSGDKLRELLGNEAMLPSRYIDDVCLYLHDYRLLKNIVNEYKVFENQLNQKDNLKPVFIFSLIVYKNLFPCEFSKEHQKNGLLYYIFNKKETLVKTLTAENEKKRAILKEERETIYQETAESAEKLREEYIFEILKKNSGVETICDTPIKEMSQVDSFDKLYSSPTFDYLYEYTHRNFKRNSKEIEFEKIEESVNPNYNYKERLKLIGKREGDRLNVISSSIISLEQENYKIKRKKLSQLYKLIPKHQWNSFLFGKGKLTEAGNLLSFLIRNGFINENYFLYISYFYPGALTTKDFEFLLNVKNDGDAKFDVILDNPNKVLSRINDDEYETKAAINLQLIALLISKAVISGKESVQLNMLVDQIKPESNEDFTEYVYPVLGKLKNQRKDLQLFIGLLINRLSYPLWKYLSEHDDSDKDEAIKLFLPFPNELIVSINNTSDGLLKAYLTEKSDFINVFDNEEMQSNICEWIDTLELKFNNLAFIDYGDNELFTYIYASSSYTISYDMLRVMLFNRLSLSENDFDQKFNSQNYTLINYEDTDNTEDLWKYVDKNLDDYLSNIYFKLEDKQVEHEDLLEAFLSTYDKDNNKLALIFNKIDTKINEISSFGNSEHWKFLFEHDCVAANWNNVIHYFIYCEKELDSTLLNWLNDESKSVEIAEVQLLNSFDALNTEEPNISQKLRLQIVNADSLEFNTYRWLVSSFPYFFNSVALEKLSRDKVKYLLSIKKLSYNVHHYSELAELSLTDELFEFTVVNVLEYINKFDEYSLNLSLIEKLLETADDVSTENKRKIASKVPLDELNRPVAREITKLLLAYRIELPYTGYEIAQIVALVSDNNLAIKSFIRLFKYFDEEDCSVILQSMGGYYKNSTVYNSFQAWDNNRYNRDVANKLKSIGFFTRIKDEGDTFRVRCNYQ